MFLLMYHYFLLCFQLWLNSPLQSSKIQRLASVYKCTLILFGVEANIPNNLIFKCHWASLDNLRPDLKGSFKGTCGHVCAREHGHTRTHTQN